MSRSDRLAKYNQLLRIEKELEGKSSYAGINAFPMMAMSVFVLFMNVYGYMNWMKDLKNHN